MMKQHLIPLAVLGLGIATLQAQDFELAPKPREVEPALKFEKITAGFQITMNREKAEGLLKLMKKVDNEKEIGELIKRLGKDDKDLESQAWNLYLFTAVTKEAPAFKKNLEEKMGENGVVIKMYGFDRSKDRPVLKAIGKAVLPKEMQDQAQGVITMINTRALIWRIEGR